MKNSTITFLFLNFYRFIWWLLLPILKKNKRLKQGLKERTSADHFKKADIWIQGASAGESNLAVKLAKKLYSRPLIEKTAFSKNYNKSCFKYPPKILLTSTTAQGIEILSLLFNQNSHKNFINIAWFPFDMLYLMESVISKVKPTVIVLIETELWPSLLFAAKKHCVEVIVINGRLSQKSYKNYMRTRWLWRLIEPDKILAVSSSDAKKFRDIFLNSQIDVMPNMKFDTIVSDYNSQNIKTSPLTNVPISIFASIRKEEEKEVIIIIQELIKQFPKQVIYLFPRHQHRIPFWKKALTKKQHKWILRSELKKTTTNQEKISAGSIVLWDIFGELKDTYPAAAAAFVGGSLKPLGGHNFLEPLMSGVPTVIGPFIDDFEWVLEDILDNNTLLGDILKMADSREEVIKFMLNTLINPSNRRDIIEKVGKYIEKKQGGTLIASNVINWQIKIKTKMDR